MSLSRTVQELLGHADVSATMVYTACRSEADSVSGARRIACDAVGCGRFAANRGAPDDAGQPIDF